MKKTPSAALKKDFSSAEMTAFWRAQEPEISGDQASQQLTTSLGRAKAKEFEIRFNYPLCKRKIAVRAGFFLSEAVRLLDTKKYDSCISLASGFSFLTYYILKKINHKLPNIKFIDTDLFDIIKERQERQKKLDSNTFKLLQKIELRILDLEEACKNGKKLQDLFIGCKQPLFLIEGVIYFLSPKCVNWLFDEIANYPNAAFIMDYWPEEGIKKSKCFAEAITKLKGFMREEVVSFFVPGFWSISGKKDLMQGFTIKREISIQEAEKELVNNDDLKLIEQNEFFPVILCSAILK